MSSGRDPRQSCKSRIIVSHLNDLFLNTLPIITNICFYFLVKFTCVFFPVIEELYCCSLCNLNLIIQGILLIR